MENRVLRGVAKGFADVSDLPPRVTAESTWFRNLLAAKSGPNSAGLAAEECCDRVHVNVCAVRKGVENCQFVRCVSLHIAPLSLRAIGLETTQTFRIEARKWGKKIGACGMRPVLRQNIWVDCEGRIVGGGRLRSVGYRPVLVGHSGDRQARHGWVAKWVATCKFLLLFINNSLINNS